MNELNFIEIGMNIKKRRQELNITQEHVAEILEINPSHISNIECGRANPSLTALVNIANILRCSVDRFLHHEYTYDAEESEEEDVDKVIAKQLKKCSLEKKKRISKIIDLM